jgi:hypothetical protein
MIIWRLIKEQGRKQVGKRVLTLTLFIWTIKTVVYSVTLQRLVYTCTLVVTHEPLIHIAAVSHWNMKQYGMFLISYTSYKLDRDVPYSLFCSARPALQFQIISRVYLGFLHLVLNELLRRWNCVIRASVVIYRSLMTLEQRKGRLNLDYYITAH